MEHGTESDPASSMYVFLTVSRNGFLTGKLTSVTINILSDDELLHIFDHYVAEAQRIEVWYTLVHVCQRWRNIVFGSSRRLNLRIVCTNSTPVRKLLDVWPALPIAIFSMATVDLYFRVKYGLGNIEAAFERSERVSQINLSMSYYDFCLLRQLEKPFPALTDLNLRFTETLDPVSPNPDKFLGGSTRLRSLSLSSAPIPGLPRLLLSSSLTDLVNLHIDCVPIEGFFSPKAIVTSLSTLTRLKSLRLNFEFKRFHSNWQNSRRLGPPPTRAVLPSLTELEFVGVSKYLEDFVAQIDAPLLDSLAITLDCYHFDQFVPQRLNTQQLVRFISHVPKFRALDEARIGIDIGDTVWIKFLSTRTSSGVLRLAIPCTEPEKNFPCLAQFCRSPFFPLPMLEDLYIDEGGFSRERWLNDEERARWLELLQPFTSVKNFHLSNDFARHIAPVLEELGGEIVTAVLPILHQKKQIYLDAACFLLVTFCRLICLNIFLVIWFVRLLRRGARLGG